MEHGTGDAFHRPSHSVGCEASVFSRTSLRVARDRLPRRGWRPPYRAVARCHGRVVCFHLTLTELLALFGVPNQGFNARTCPGRRWCCRGGTSARSGRLAACACPTPAPPRRAPGTLARDRALAPRGRQQSPVVRRFAVPACRSLWLWPRSPLHGCSFASVPRVLGALDSRRSGGPAPSVASPAQR